MSSVIMNRGRGSNLSNSTISSNINTRAGQTQPYRSQDYASRVRYSKPPRVYNRNTPSSQTIYTIEDGPIATRRMYQNQYLKKKRKTNLNIDLTSVENEQEPRPWFIWIISLIQLCIFIGELTYYGVLMGSPIETNFSLNPLFGPGAYFLIYIGASFSPCMHGISGITDNLTSTNFPCPNSASTTTTGCTLGGLCGFNGISGTPNQWFRFITPIFLHTGIIHIVFNLFGQLAIAGKVERSIGVIRTVIIYFVSGIFGFILGGNFAPNGLARLGCSGSLFSMIALSFLDLFYNWSTTSYPKIQLVLHLADVVISFVLGLLPGVDNFSHIGGFVMGLLLGLAILGSPKNIKRLATSRRTKRSKNKSINQQNSRKFFQNRRKSWWAWWVVRFIALAIAITMFVMFTESFYSGRIQCSGCKYMSCLPVNGWCDMGVLKTRNNSTR